MGRPAAILFDLDDTLYERAPCFRRWAEWFIREQLGASSEQDTAALLATFVDLDGQGYRPKQDLFRWVKGQYPGIQSTEDELIEAFYREYIQCLVVDDVTETFLRTLEECQIPFGVVTNGSSHQLTKLATMGLDRRTTCVFVSEIVGVKKPSAAIFLAAATALNVPPSGTLFIGDDPDNDIVRAMQVGMRTAWLHRGRDWPGRLIATRPDYTIASFTDLIPIVQRSTAGRV